jgi:hypothetical protein
VIFSILLQHCTTVKNGMSLSLCLFLFIRHLHDDGWSVLPCHHVILPFDVVASVNLNVALLWRRLVGPWTTFRLRGVLVPVSYGQNGPGIESREGGRFSAPVQTDPGTHPAPCTMGTGSFPGVESGRGLTLTPHPF